MQKSNLVKYFLFFFGYLTSDQLVKPVQDGRPGIISRTIPLDRLLVTTWISAFRR